MLPGVAPVAIQEGRFVAKLIREEVERAGSNRNLEGAPSLSRSARQGGGFDSRLESRPPSTTGTKAASPPSAGPPPWPSSARIHISGFIAWLSWLFVHILFLIGFRNRLLVFIQWAWSYVTYERGARLITGSTYLPGWTASTGFRRGNRSRTARNPRRSAK